MKSESNPETSAKLEAFERLVSEYEAPLLRYANRILRNGGAAEDVVQNAFVRLLRTWRDEWTPSRQLSNWLYQVVHNCAIDHIRRESRRSILHVKHAEESPQTLAPDLGPSFRISENAELAARALEALDLRERQLVLLKVYEEKSYREISEITGLTVSNVGYILHHAMKKLADTLQRLRGAKEL